MTKIFQMTVVLVFSFLMVSPIISADQVVLPEKNRMKPDHAPTPYSAGEIRKGCPTGRTSVYLVRIPGKVDTCSVSIFIGNNKTFAEFEGKTTDLSGKQLGEKQHARVKWIDLQGHASFPEKNTTVKKETITIKGGTFKCILYIVKSGSDVKKLWFAKNLPGAPVKFLQFKSGKQIYSMELIKDFLDTKISQTDSGKKDSIAADPFNVR